MKRQPASAAPTQGLADWMAEAGRLRDGGRPAEAEALLRQAVEAAPDAPEPLVNHGLLLADLGRYGEAALTLRRAVALAPGMAAAWTNLSLALLGLGDAAGAAQAQQRAFEIDPTAPAALVGNGIALLHAGQLGAALAAFRRAVQTDAGQVEGWINLGLALQAQGDARGARRCFETALSLRPHERRALSNLLMGTHYDPTLDAQDLRHDAHRAAALWPTLKPRPAVRAGLAAGGRLRVGYLSGDFYAHPVGWLLAPVLQAHDPAAVEIHLFDHRTHPATPDPVTESLRAASAQWHGVARLDDAALAAHIAEAGIDVLVELSGHTETGRLGVLAHRPAPVQLSWLGYFGSTGVPAVDALVLGDALAPPGTEAGYTEPLERVPGLHFGYTPPPYAPQPGPAPSVHAGCVTFGSFNNPAKMNDAVVATWAQVLHAVPGSRLVLKWKSYADPVFAAQTRSRYAAHGIDPQRLQLRPASEHVQMLAEYADVDVALDPYPFCGLITTLEALWMGVPVVTLPWQRPVSRQSHAVLQALGLQAWSCNQPREFVIGAAALAADVASRQTWRGSGPDALRGRLQASPLMRAEPLARALEGVYRRRLAALRPNDHATPTAA